MTHSKSRPPAFFTVKAVAGQLSVSEKTVHRWIDDGKLRAHRFGRSLRISEDDVSAFTSARRR